VHLSTPELRVRIMKRTLIAAACLVLAAGCATGTKITSGQVANTPSAPPNCTPVVGHTDAGANDTASLPPGGFAVNSSTDYIPGSTAQFLQGYEVIAVLKVISRAAPQPVAADNQIGARPASSHASSIATDQMGYPHFKVIRTTRLAVLRNLKGALASCQDLDIPGGTSGKYRMDDPQFPATFAPGDELLGLFSTHDNAAPGQSVTVAPYAQILLRAAPDGSLTLPFGDHDQINVNTWNPPSS
jgi:hypothetical protein